MKVSFHELAVRDLLEAQYYYSSVSPSLSRAFRREIDSLVETAAKNPEHFHFLSSSHASVVPT